MATFEVSTDREKLDIPLVHRFLSEHSSWAIGIPRTTLEIAIVNSLCFGGYIGPSQVAFARVISDYATFANLVDVFVMPLHRGQGYSKAMVQAIVSHPKLQGLRRFTLATSDAHDLYAQFGFTTPSRPHSLMERFDPELYRTST